MSDNEEVDLAKIINLLDRSITIAIQAREKLSQLHKEYVGNTNVGVDKEAGRLEARKVSHKCAITRQYETLYYPAFFPFSISYDVLYPVNHFFDPL